MDNKQFKKIIYVTVLFNIHFIIYQIVIAQDPCLDGNFREIDNVAKRSPSYDYDFTLLPCDRYLIEGWYGSKSHVMSTSPPLLQKCGTSYPVWLKGRLTLKFNYEHQNYIKRFCVPIIAFVKNGKKEQLYFFYISSIILYLL